MSTDVAPAPMHLELFGPVTLALDDVRLTPVGRPAQVLVALASRRGVPMPAEALLDMLWPEAPASGLNVLQRHVSALRPTGASWQRNQATAQAYCFQSLRLR